MNFDKESKSEDLFLAGGGGGGRRRGILTEKKQQQVFVYFVLMLNIGVRAKKGQNSASVLRNSVKIHLNMDSEQSSEFQDPSSSNSLHIMLTRYFYCYES